MLHFIKSLFNITTSKEDIRLIKENQRLIGVIAKANKEIQELKDEMSIHLTQIESVEKTIQEMQKQQKEKSIAEIYYQVKQMEKEIEKYMLNPDKDMNREAIYRSELLKRQALVVDLYRQQFSGRSFTGTIGG